jgi:hypothetical protein
MVPKNKAKRQKRTNTTKRERRDSIETKEIAAIEKEIGRELAWQKKRQYGS